MSYDIIGTLLSIPAVLIALTVHECAHGYAAYRLGDPTARSLGRLSLNPLKHLDPVGAVFMLFFHFGWAKPVPVNARFFKNPKKGMALTALAGPVTNLFLGLFSAFLYALLYVLFYSHFYAVKILASTAAIDLLCYYGIDAIDVVCE